MATKQIKKTTKNIKTTAKKATVKKAPVVEQETPCPCGCGCGCHKHGFMHFLKKLIILAIVFLLGMFAGQSIHFGKPKSCPFNHMQPVFTNGCLDMSAIKCPKMQEKLLAADVNGDGCVSAEEYKAMKQQMFQGKKRFPGHKHQPRD
jgi:hypothetical protein